MPGRTVRSSGTGISFQGNLTNNGLIEFANDSDFTRTHNGGFVNNGTVRKSGGVGETVLTDLNMDANGQTLDVDTGTLRANSGGDVERHDDDHAGGGGDVPFCPGRRLLRAGDDRRDADGQRRGHGGARCGHGAARRRWQPHVGA